MSSHHIVRERQEPALYIHQLGDFNEELLGQLLEWSPTIIVAESEYDKLESLGIKVDVIAGHDEGTARQEHTGFLRNDNGSIDTVVGHLIKEGYPAVNIISTGNPDNILENDAINIVWLNALEKTYPVKNGFNVWKPAGTAFKFGNEEAIKTTNLKRHSDGYYYAVADGFITFNFDKKRILLTELL